MKFQKSTVSFKKYTFVLSLTITTTRDFLNSFATRLSAKFATELIIHIGLGLFCTNIISIVTLLFYLLLHKIWIIAKC